MIQVKRTTSQVRKVSSIVLDDGQPLYEKDTKLLFFGDGDTLAKSLSPVKVDDSDFAKLSDSNQFSGDNTFTAGLKISSNKIQNSAGNDITLPNKAGTIATVQDVTDAVNSALGSIENQLAQIDTGTGV